MSIRDRVLSEQNIYAAIYALENSIGNKELICNKDLNGFRDIYNQKNVLGKIKEVKNRLIEVIDEEDKFLKCKIYFKPKDLKNKDVIFRPIHHFEDLIDCVAAIAMLNVLIYDEEDICEHCTTLKTCPKKKRNQGECERNGKKVTVSNLVKLLPDDFYGNKISHDLSQIYMPWQRQYRDYTSKASELFLRYHNTKEYSFEVDIDIENFFPSINPQYVIEYILNSLPVYIEKGEKKVIEKILIKLLYLEVTNKSITDTKFHKIWKEYYQSESILSSKKGKKFTVGIPQGLVQSYFFANIFMILIKECYKKVFKGEALFYVDDSVIFTNEHIDEKFEKYISDVEKEINDKVSKLLENSTPYDFVQKNEYKITLHKNDDKSTYTNILQPKQGEIYLNNLCRQASQITMDIQNAFSDNEDVTLLARVKKMFEEIVNEIDFIKGKKEQLEKNGMDVGFLDNYIEKLIRYKKFFKYRMIVLEFREKLLFNDVYKNFISNVLSQDLEEFFKFYKDDILMTLVSVAISMTNKSRDREEVKGFRKKIIEYIKEIDEKLFGYVNEDCSYLLAVVNKLEEKTEKVNRHKKLEDYAREKFPDYRGAHDSVREEAMNELLNTNIEKNITGIFEDKFNKIISTVYCNTNQIKRDLVNCVFSNIINVILDDSYNFSKRENRMLSYKEIRILAYIRNYHFDMESFKEKLSEFKEEEMEKIDYSLLEVMKCFRAFVKDPDRIDDLIRIHQYTYDIWKNGSKYLYFYTLHNQEHAVLLIKNSIELVKSINFIKLSKMDYYILFIACYLHDISMVTIPNLQMFCDNNEETNLISTQFMLDKDRKSKDSREVKNLLVRYYKQLDEFYEKQVRNSHAYKSGQEIRRRKDLDFIQTFAREIVAQVAEAHGHSIDEVYKSKSVASDTIYSKKFMQIILRLADLLDISSNRVSKPILTNNIDNMSLTSSFHWISHLATEKYKINVVYEDDGTTPSSDESEEQKEFKSYLTPKRIIEKITIEIYVNFQQFTKENNISCENMQLKYDNANNCEFVLECGEKCDSTQCNFMCKWIAKKNSYLFHELSELQRYLNDNISNFYFSKICVKVITTDKINLTSKQLDILKNVIDVK